MKAAFSIEGDRIAPVFDAARNLLVLEEKDCEIVSMEEKKLDGELQIENAIRLSKMGVETLLCGAISSSFKRILSAYGIKVLPFLTGKTDEIVRGWLSGNIPDAHFSMPGCSTAENKKQRRKKRHRNGGCRREW